MPYHCAENKIGSTSHLTTDSSVAVRAKHASKLFSAYLQPGHPKEKYLARGILHRSTIGHFGHFTVRHHSPVDIAGGCTPSTGTPAPIHNKPIFVKASAQFGGSAR